MTVAAAVAAADAADNAGDAVALRHHISTGLSERRLRLTSVHLSVARYQRLLWHQQQVSQQTHASRSAFYVSQY